MENKEKKELINKVITTGIALSVKQDNDGYKILSIKSAYGKGSESIIVAVYFRELPDICSNQHIVVEGHFENRQIIVNGTKKMIPIIVGDSIKAEKTLVEVFYGPEHKGMFYSEKKCMAVVSGIVKKAFVDPVYNSSSGTQDRYGRYTIQTKHGDKIVNLRVSIYYNNNIPEIQVGNFVETVCKISTKESKKGNRYYINPLISDILVKS